MNSGDAYRVGPPYGVGSSRMREDQVLVRYLRKLRGTLHVCIEECPWSEWLHEVLSPTRPSKSSTRASGLPGSKNDSIDARGLTEKLRIGQAGPGVFKPCSQYRKLREWARDYQALTQDVARAKNRLKSLLLCRSRDSNPDARRRGILRKYQGQ